MNPIRSLKYCNLIKSWNLIISYPALVIASIDQFALVIFIFTNFKKLCIVRITHRPNRGRGAQEDRNHLAQSVRVAEESVRVAEENSQAIVSSLNTTITSLDDRRQADIRREERQERLDAIREREMHERWAADREERRLILSTMARGIGLSRDQTPPPPSPTSAQQDTELAVHDLNDGPDSVPITFVRSETNMSE